MEQECHRICIINRNSPDRSTGPARTRGAALARFLGVPANAVIQHLADPWCFTVGSEAYFIMTREEARSTCAHGIETLLPRGIPAETLGPYVPAISPEAAVAEVRRLQRRRDRATAAEDLLGLLGERWVEDLMEKEGVEHWLEKALGMRYRGSSDPYLVFDSR